MFEDLKQQLSAVQSKLTAMIGTAQSTLAALKTNVSSIGQGATAAIDAVSGQVQQTQGAVDQRLGSVKSDIQGLAPPS